MTNTEVISVVFLFFPIASCHLEILHTQKKFQWKTSSFMLEPMQGVSMSEAETNPLVFSVSSFPNMNRETAMHKWWQLHSGGMGTTNSGKAFSVSVSTCERGRWDVWRMGCSPLFWLIFCPEGHSVMGHINGLRRLKLWSCNKSSQTQEV